METVFNITLVRIRLTVYLFPSVAAPIYPVLCSMGVCVCGLPLTAGLGNPALGPGVT